MTADRVRRFTALQVVLHWGQAVPYVVLLATGVTAVCQRVFGGQIVPPAVLSLIHRCAGATLAIVLGALLVALVVARQTGHVVRDVISCFVFRGSDLLWLLRAPLQVIWPHAPLPPAGRFNAGQKLHGAFIVLAVPCFIATGILLLRQPASLGPRAMHVALAVPAVGFLTLHLFLALVNPPTRKALAGIFRGTVPRLYAQSHHPRWVGGPTGHPHGPIISRKAVLWTILLATVGVGAVLWGYEPKRVREWPDRWARAWAGEALSPGPLAAAHADDPHASRCLACHSLLGPPPDSSCLACHEEIQRVQKARQGYHGRLTGPCRQCHAEHAGRDADLRGLDAASFDHARARFHLAGKHRDTACAACHAADGKPLHYIGLEFASCRACHKDPHLPAQPRQCTSCHTEAGWSKARVAFDHATDTSFPLVGRHAATACEACHAANRDALGASQDVREILPLSMDEPPQAGGFVFVLREVGRACASCHADPHRPTLGSECRGCHSADGWTGESLAFRHDRDSMFPLHGAHEQAACRTCHRTAAAGTTLAEARFRGLGTACDDCHQDPHRSALGSACIKCHTETGWTAAALQFRHDRDSGFALNGRHADTACRQCHKPAPRLADATFVGTSTQCAVCHRDPHRGQIDKTCAACHNEDGWTGKNLQFRHDRDSDFALRGRHASTACAGCHKPAPHLGDATFAGTPTQCATCHQDPHQSQMDKTCTACHSEQGWRGKDLRFAHNRDSTFRIDAIHSSSACGSCHKPSGGVVRYRPLPTACERCHKSVADSLAGKSPLRTGKADPHSGRVTCRQCHSPSVASPTPAQYAAACVTCHNSQYRDLYFRWTQSLAERTARAEKLLARARANPGAAGPSPERIARAIAAARAIGPHNLQLAREILDEVLKQNQPK